MADDKIKAYDRHGEKITVDKTEIGKLYALGGRIATKAEVSEHTLEEEYSKASTLEKVSGAVTGIGARHPQLEAWHRGAVGGLTAGLGEAAIAKGAEAAMPGAGKAYAERSTALEEAFPSTHTAGEVAGMLGGAAIGSAAGGGAAGLAAKAIPGAGISAIGGAVEGGVGRALAGVAARGAAGRAAVTAAEIGARGAVEGGLMGATQYAGHELLQDHDLAADKLFAASGTGALYGLGGGALLGGAGSLLASGGRALGGLARGLTRAERAALPEAAAQAGKEVTLGAEALDAGLKDAAPKAESPFSFDRREVSLRGQGKMGKPSTEEPIDIFSRSINPDAGIAARDSRGAFQGKFATEDPLYTSAAKTARRQVGIAPDAAELGAVPAKPAFEIPKPDAAAPAPRSIVTDLTTRDGMKGLAYDRAWGSLGSGFGLQSTEFAKRAQRYLPNGTRDVGEVMMRKGIIDPNASLVDAARVGTPASMLPKLEAEVESVGRRIGEITDASGGRVPAEGVMRAIDDVAKVYEASAATRPVGRSLRTFGDNLLDSLGIAKGAESVTVQDVLRERKALDMMVFENAPLDPALATQVKRDLRGRLEGLVVDALDEASGKLKGDLATEYKGLKKDYLALNIAKEAAEDSSARAAKAGFFGLKDVIGGGGSLLQTLGLKMARERGDAVLATTLYQAAERGTLAKLVQRVDGDITKASKGLLEPPKAGAPKASDRMPPMRALAKTALARVAEFKADPEAYVDKATKQTEAMATHSPELAGALVSRNVQAMALLSSKVPVSPDPDPLDPHPARRMTSNEEAELARYAWYVDKPQRFFAEVARGKMTFEGAEVARSLMPRAFAELQEKTAETLALQLAKGQKLPFRQRQVLGVLLDMATTPSQRPEHAAFLQKNVLPLQEEPPTAPAPKRSVSISTQRSALDRLEADGPGKR